MELKDRSTQIVDLIKRHANHVITLSSFIKIVLLIGGAAVAGIAQFTEFPDSGPTTGQIVGISACVVVFLGALFVALTEENSVKELQAAHQAIEEARAVREEYRDLDHIEDEFAKVVELYQVMNLSRGVIERSVRMAQLTEISLITGLLNACDRSAVISMGFSTADRWTICIYRAEMEADGNVYLTLVAHNRAIKCDIAKARKWQAGTGIAGSAYANRDEIVIPDLQTPGLKAVFGTAANTIKPEDPTLYRSMAAVPVIVDGMAEPWGVVSATNDKPDHFSPGLAMGIDPIETVRALANLVALAIACYHKPTTKTGA